MVGYTYIMFDRNIQPSESLRKMERNLEKEKADTGCHPLIKAIFTAQQGRTLFCSGSG